MLVLMLAVNDPAGTAVQMARAVNRHTPHTCRLATLETRYNHDWPKDLHVPDLDAAGLAELGDLLAAADVLHFHMTCDEHQPFGPHLPADYLAGKALVHHHHGHHDFRGNPVKYQEKYRALGRRNLLVSTPDLLALLPGARWQPNLVPIHEPLLMPDEDRPAPPPVRLCHSPTRKDLKNTDDLLAVAGELAGPGLELDLIDDAPNSECLARKRRCHVCFDHMQGYYGVSSLEALSQGVAAIAGLDDFNRARVAEFAGTDDLPWLVAHDREQLRALLAGLAAEPERALKAGVRGRAFMEQRWSDARLAGQLAAFWEGLD